MKCLAGLLPVRDVPDRRFIAPSRFGYLGSSMPPNATPAAHADDVDPMDTERVEQTDECVGLVAAVPKEFATRG